MALDGIAVFKGASPAVPGSRGDAPAPKDGPAVAGGGSAAPRAAPQAPDLSQVIENLTRALQASQSNLSFSVDESTGKTIVRIFRSSTGELVRQIPSEEALAIAASLAQGGQVRSLGLDRWS
jgi:flagellar protein FlaG